MNDARIACIFAHPDDETFCVGGIVAKYAARGAVVDLYCATDGDAGKVASVPVSSRQELAALRRNECRTACDILGIREIKFGGYADGGLDQVDATELPHLRSGSSSVANAKRRSVRGPLALWETRCTSSARAATETAPIAKATNRSFISHMKQTKGERTRERIVATVAPIFNQRGYAGTSLEDVMAASGLKKGGVYRHFDSKDELALSAFDYARGLHGARIREHVGAATTAELRINAIAHALASNIENPPLPGGCPLLNTAVECDDGVGPVYTQLRARARRAMTSLIDYTRDIIADGVQSGELRSDIDAEDEAKALVGTLEGALMLSKLYNDTAYVRRAAERVEAHSRTLVAERPRRARAGRSSRS